MRRKILFWVVLTGMVVSGLTACSSDDDNQQSVTPETTGHSVEVCIVFAPKDLGDQGYSDRILAGMFQFDKQLSSEDYDRAFAAYL